MLCQESSDLDAPFIEQKVFLYNDVLGIFFIWILPLCLKERNKKIELYVWEVKESGRVANNNGMEEYMSLPWLVV